MRNQRDDQDVLVARTQHSLRGERKLDSLIARGDAGDPPRGRGGRAFAQAELERQLYDKPRTQPEPISWESSAMLIVALMVAGGVLGWVIASIGNGPEFTMWQSLGLPPQRATKILGADPGEVYVQTQEGTAYRFRDQWEATDWPRPLPSSSEGCFSSFPASSSDDIDSIKVQLCGEVIAATKYAIRSDGSVWRWEYLSNGMDQIGRVLLYPPIFAAIGLAVGVVIVVILRNK